MNVVFAEFPPASGELPPRHALVFSPCLPEWDEGQFFAPVTQVLRVAGFRVTVVDTLSLWDSSTTTVRDLASRFEDAIARFGDVDLLVGNALGGAVAQALIGVIAPPDGVLLVSAPTRADPILASRLAAIAELAEQGRDGAATRLLNRRVLPDGVPAPSGLAEPSADPRAGLRLARGMRLLLELDLTEDVLAYQGPLIHIVGARSQLVTETHVAGAAHHSIVTVPGAGMRPHSENSELVAGIVKRFVSDH